MAGKRNFLLKVSWTIFVFFGAAAAEVQKWFFDLTAGVSTIETKIEPPSRLPRRERYWLTPDSVSTLADITSMEATTVAVPVRIVDSKEAALLVGDGDCGLEGNREHDHVILSEARSVNTE